MSDLLNINLPKWPACLVLGTPVTREQAMEIIIRTDSWYIHANDRDWQCEVKEIAGLPSDDLGWKEHYEAVTKFRSDLGVLDLSYLNNARIASSYIGGPNGWCDWDGQIRQTDKNIGKWPSVEAVLDEWKTIAEAFPFLNLKCQLFNAEYCEDSPKALVQFNVSSGTVELVEPQFDICPENNIDSFLSRLYAPGRERGCTRQQLEEALAHVRAKMNDDRQDEVQFHNI